MRTYFFLFLLLCSGALHAQQTNQELSATIRGLDSLFWDAYNKCDTAKISSFFTDDVEFYHDKGGPTYGLPALAQSFSKNLCSNSTWHLRREAVEGSYKVFPMKQDNVIYGAILYGEHMFYIVETGKGERLDGLARFTHLWLLKDGAWKMKRVLSYDHGPATYRNKRKEITLSAASLSAYTGKYQGPQNNIVAIVENNQLTLIINGKKYSLFAEKEGLFFDKERDLTFAFIKGQKLTVRENGAIAEELVFVK